MWGLWVIGVFALTIGSVGEGWSEDAIGTRPLLTITLQDLPRILPAESRLTGRAVRGDGAKDCHFTSGDGLDGGCLYAKSGEKEARDGVVCIEFAGKIGLAGFGVLR